MRHALIRAKTLQPPRIRARWLVLARDYSKTDAQALNRPKIGQAQRQRADCFSRWRRPCLIGARALGSTALIGQPCAKGGALNRQRGKT